MKERYLTALHEQGFHITEKGKYARVKDGVTTEVTSSKGYIKEVKHSLGNTILHSKTFSMSLECLLGYKQELEPYKILGHTATDVLSVQGLEHVLTEYGFKRGVTIEGPTPFHFIYNEGKLAPRSGYYFEPYQTTIYISMEEFNGNTLLYISVEGYRSSKIQSYLEQEDNVFSAVLERLPMPSPSRDREVLPLTYVNVAEALAHISFIIESRTSNEKEKTQ